MKKLLFISALTIGLYSCKKDKTIEPVPASPKWGGLYHSATLMNDSTGSIADPNTDINLTESGDSIRFYPVNTIYGSAFFYNVLSANTSVHLSAKKSGSVATIGNKTWTLNGKVHTITSGTITMNSDNTKTLKYSETIQDTVLLQYHYTGVYK